MFSLSVEKQFLPTNRTISIVGYNKKNFNVRQKNETQFHIFVHSVFKFV